MTSWGSHPLPSGSLNDVYAKDERPSLRIEARGRRSYTSLTSTPRVDETVSGGVDVFDREQQPVSRPRLRRRETLAEVDEHCEWGIYWSARKSSPPVRSVSGRHPRLW